MKLQRLDARGRREMEAALRKGEPILLELRTPPPPEVRLDDIVPMCTGGVRAWDSALTRSLQAFLPPPARPGNTARVTAVIPTHRSTPLGLGALRSQDMDVEVLVLLNDGGRWPHRRKPDVDGDRVVWVPWEGHGPTRQRGVEMADGEYVLFTVDDALPMGAGFVRTLVEALESDTYDAVFARQIPWPTSDPVTARRLREWTPPGHHVRPSRGFDHVAALFRRETLLRFPLPAVHVAEDMHWARSHRIGYVPTAPVVHAHPRRPLPLYRRTVEVHTQLIAAGEKPRIPDASSLVGAIPRMLRPILDGGPREILNQSAEMLGQWQAARRAQREH
jgi:hypothetical protein